MRRPVSSHQPRNDIMLLTSSKTVSAPNNLPNGAFREAFFIVSRCQAFEPCVGVGAIAPIRHDHLCFARADSIADRGSACCFVGPVCSTSIGPVSVPSASMTRLRRPSSSPGIPSSTATESAEASYSQRQRASIFCSFVSSLCSRTSSGVAKNEAGSSVAFSISAGAIGSTLAIAKNSH